MLCWWKFYDLPPSLEAGHYVTCAGVNSTTLELLIADPWQDAHEAGLVPGRSPVPHPYPHASNVHNDAQYVSHDAYNVSQWMLPPPPGYLPMPWELVGYLETIVGPIPGLHTFIRAAVTTSPLAVHDVAVTNVTVCYGATIVHHNHTACINVTVTNEGDVTETFDVTVYWNTTNAIQTIQFTLPSGGTNSTCFSWDTNGLTIYKNYTISAYAHPVPSEADLTDNNFLYGDVLLVHEGDVNADKKVDIEDIFNIALLFGSVAGDSRYDPNHDVNCDGKIDIEDIFLAALNFGYTYP